jgi:hypothetical protein
MVRLERHGDSYVLVTGKSQKQEEDKDSTSKLHRFKELDRRRFIIAK